jgi:2,4-dienoyl-CoA reductase-like NADH-dependent reductase (Old Yellow Enzyme family)
VLRPVIINPTSKDNKVDILSKLLFEPFQIGNIEIKNRLMRSATYYGLADKDGFIGDESVHLMKELAANDVGLIITGYAYVEKNGQCFIDMNGIQDDDHIPGYQKITQAVHELDGKIVMQIVHGGIEANTVAQTHGDLVAVSIPEMPPDHGSTPKLLADEDIETIVTAFGKAAGRVQEAGFDGVQIHGAHGYLVTQFLSPQSNQRTDRWGGSLENRMRFVVEITRAIKSQVDDDFPIMIKLGCRDYSESPDRLTIDDGTEVVRALEAEGLCHVEISHGIVDRSHRKLSVGITSSDREAYMLDDARTIRRASAIPLGLVGGMRSPSLMEDILQAGTVDTLSLCRPLIREPDLVKKWKEGSTKSADCVSCGRCINRKIDTATIECAQL